MGLAAPQHVGPSGTRDPDPCALHWWANSFPLDHQGSPASFLFQVSDTPSCGDTMICTSAHSLVDTGGFHLLAFVSSTAMGFLSDHLYRRRSSFPLGVCATE